MADLKKGMSAVQYVKDLMHPPRHPSDYIYKASDAFAPYADKNIVVGVTQADRTIAQPSGRLKGGPLFSMLGEVDPAYKGKTWGFDSSGHAQGMLNAFDAQPADTMLMTTILGGPLMQGSNSEIFKRTSKAYRDAIANNKLLPEHLKKTNEVVQGMTDKKGGVNLFDPDSDVTDPAFWKGLTTFQQRRAMNDIMGGIGVGGPKSGGAIFDWQKIMDKTTEPMLRDVPTRSVGPRIWTLDGGKEYSPHLNKAYPDIVTGVDQNINFNPVPYQDFLKDFTDNFMQTKNRVPNWKNLTMGHPKTQEITDQWLQHLKNTGNAEGGLIKGMAGGGTPPAASMDGEQFMLAAAKAGMPTDIGSLNKIVDLVNKGLSIDEAIEALTNPMRKRDGGQVDHMQHGGIMPRAGIYYPTSNDERNQAAGLPADFYRKGMTDVASHGYHAGIDVPAGDARLTADLMGSRYVSPQMTRDSINALRLGAEFPVGEGRLRAELMKGLAPNVPTNVGLRYSRPFAEGGAVEHMQAGGIKKAGSLLLSELDNAIAGVGTAGRSPIVPAPNRWFLNPDKHPHQQGMVERVLERTGRPRESFTSGAFIDPRTGEVLDSKILEDVGVVINPRTNRPAMSAGKEAGIDELEKELGLITKSNLVRNSLFKRSGGDPMLDDLAFLATIERSGMGHKYGLSTEYGSPTLLHNNQTGANPTLRPTSRGDVFGMGDVVGQVNLGKGIPHDVYEKLFVAPAGMDVPGVRLHKADGGVAHMQAGGVMGMIERLMAQKAANAAAKAPKALTPLERQYALDQFKAGSADPRQFYHGSRHYYLDDATSRAVIAPDEGIRNLQTPSQLKNWNYQNNADAVFLTPESSFSNAFAGDIKDAQARPAVYPVHAQVKNPFDIHNQEHANSLIDAYKRMHMQSGDEEQLKNFQKTVAFAQRDPANWATLENNRVQDAIKSLGHDSFYVTENGVKNLGVYNPNLIKSSLGNRGTFDINEADMGKADGGAVHSQIGGMQPELAGGSARQETFAAQHMEEGGDIMRSLFDHALEKGDIHDMTHALLVQQHEAEHG